MEVHIRMPSPCPYGGKGLLLGLWSAWLLGLHGGGGSTVSVQGPDRCDSFVRHDGGAVLCQPAFDRPGRWTWGSHR
jgi:hypothetical protein